MSDSRQPGALGWAARLEDALLVMLLGLLVVLATGQMLARNLFDSGWSEADPLMRTLVLWVGLTGAMIATRENRHIAILILHERLPERVRPYVAIAAQLFTAVVAATIAFHGFRFVQMEAVNTVIAFAGIPTWASASIIPFAFAVIALRATEAAWRVWRRKRR